MDQQIQGHPDMLHLETLEACPLCGGSSLMPRFHVHHITGDPLHSWASDQGFPVAPIVSCDDCGFVFKSVQPSERYLGRHYAELPEEYVERVAEEFSEHREDYRVAGKALAKSFPAGGSILDVGCASGYFLHLLGERWEKHGLELFHLAAERARKRGGINVHECALTSAAFEPETFDVVCSFDVIEHLSNPMAFFREARRILKPSGWLLLGTGDALSVGAVLSGSRWTYFAVPEHVSFFTRRSLKLGLRKVGFPIVEFTKIHHGERKLSVAMGWTRAVGKQWAIAVFGEGITRLRLFRQKTTEFLVPYFFDHMISIAKRKGSGYREQ